MTQVTEQSVRLQTALSSIFFFNDTATTEIYTLSLHDALPIYLTNNRRKLLRPRAFAPDCILRDWSHLWRSEEHTSELQSRLHLVCRLLLEKKNNSDFCRLGFNRRLFLLSHD